MEIPILSSYFVTIPNVRSDHLYTAYKRNIMKGFSQNAQTHFDSFGQAAYGHLSAPSLSAPGLQY